MMSIRHNGLYFLSRINEHVASTVILILVYYEYIDIVLQGEMNKIHLTKKIIVETYQIKVNGGQKTKQEGYPLCLQVSL